MSMIIPPASDLEAMAKFFDEYPGWSPVFDDEGVQIGVASPMIQFPMYGHIKRSGYPGPYPLAGDGA